MNLRYCAADRGDNLSGIRTKCRALPAYRLIHEHGYLNPRYRWWTAAEKRLLRRIPDKEVARRTGRSLQAIVLKRIKLGLVNPAAKRRNWKARELKLLGKYPDEEVARMVCRSVAAVEARRQQLGRKRLD